MTPSSLNRVQLVCGLPRTGSTLLLNLLAQNSRHRVTATNGLANLLALTAKSWPRNDAFRAQGLEVVRPHVRSALQGMVSGFHAQALENPEIVVFDKSRAWLQTIGLVQDVLGPDKRVVVCIRDVRDIVASMEELYQKNPMTRGPMPDSTLGRVKMLLDSEGGIVGGPITALRDAIRQGHAKHMVPVRYHDLVEDPVGTLAQLHRDLGLDPWDGYDSNNVQQVTQEDDMLLAGLPGLHDVKREVKPDRRERWRGALPEGVARMIEDQYGDIQRLVHHKA